MHLQSFALFAFISLFKQSEAQEVTFKHELNLKVHYQVTCNENDESGFPGVTVEAKLKNRTLRFQLLKYLNETEVSLGSENDLNQQTPHFVFLPSKNCTLNQFEPQIEKETTDTKTDIQKLAYAHSPYVVIRKDQFRYFTRDIPLGITYSVHPDSKGFKIRYTYFFSNEITRSPFDTSKPTSLGSYGRRTDIEWIYEVQFSKDGRLLARRYQGGVLWGIGHATHSFKGRFLNQTLHPILYNISNHNVFSDHAYSKIQRTKKTAYHLIPREELLSPDAREMWMWQRPWTFKISDLELKRNGELSHPSDEYLYVRLHGDLAGGKIKVQARLKNNPKTLIVAGEGKGTMSKLGVDLWGKESFSAIHLGSNFLSEHGKLEIKRNKRDTVLQAPRFYRLIPNVKEGFIAQEVTDHFHCPTSYHCEF